MAYFKLRFVLLLVATQAPGLISNAYADEVTLVSNGGFYTLDLSSIEDRGDTRVAWTRIEYEWDHFLPSNESYRSAVVLTAYNCSKRLWAIAAETLYEDGSASGRVVRHRTNSATELRWSPLQKNAIEARQLHRICHERSN